MGARSDPNTNCVPMVGFKGSCHLTGSLLSGWGDPKKRPGDLILIISENKRAAALGEGEDGMVCAVLGAVNASRF
jgi:hypothetical protein